MSQFLNVYALPTLVTPEQLAGATVVVIDVLRASTTIVHALEAGAKEVIPCLELDDARAAAAKRPRSEVVLGGERHGLPIEGFDLGNSPGEYTPRTVGGRTVLFTTTNGTRAMWQCRRARRVLIGAFVNATAVCEQLLRERQIHLICAGTDGQFSRDDVLMAGLLVQRLTRPDGIQLQLNAQAVTARENWASSFPLPYVLGAEPIEPDLIAHQLRNSIAGQHLTAIGREEDILAASAVDRFHCVPELDTSTFRIRQPQSADEQ